MHKELLAAVILTLSLGSYRGYIAIFENGSPEPMQVFPQRTDSLPISDQDDLKKGIRVRNQEEMDRLLEDFLS